MDVKPCKRLPTGEQSFAQREHCPLTSNDCQVAGWRYAFFPRCDRLILVSSTSKTRPTSRASSKPASLKTVASYVGLSIAAVSRVLSGAPAARSIPLTTQERIFAAAKRFNYQPNISARSLRSRRSYTVGVMVPEVSEGYATLVLSGIEQQLMEDDYFYFVVSHRHRSELIEKYQHLLMARSIEGLIAVDTALAHQLSVPTVTISGQREPEGVTKIVLNHQSAATLALEHLHSFGHTKIAFIKGQSFSSDTQSRWRAILNAAAKLNIAIVPALVARLGSDTSTHEPGYDAMQQILATGAPFTALFAFNDTSAIGAIQAIRGAGLRVPEDISVVGFDDIPSAAYQNPALTTIRQPMREMGRIAVRQLLSRIRDRSDGTFADRIMVEPELVVRGSSAPRRALPPKRPRQRSKV